MSQKSDFNSQLGSRIHLQICTSNINNYDEKQ